MATFASSCTDIDWLWGSLKPWQILHSTLAERERNGSGLDVWELVNETLGAANYPSNSIAREELLHADADVDKEERSTWAQGMRFLGDDGEFWKPGGVMESRVREWLSRRLQDNGDDDGDDNEEQQELALVASPLPSAHHQLAIAAYSSTYSTAEPNLLQRADDELVQLDAAAVPDPRHAYIIGATADNSQSIDDSDTEEEFIESQGAEIGVDLIALHDQASAPSAAAEDLPDIYNYRDNYALISSNYEDDGRQYNGISSSECRLVVNRFCSRGAATSDREYHNSDQLGGAAHELAVGQSHLEGEIVEEVEVCAVCLEKLLIIGGDGDEEDAAVQALACRHLFHRACIAPWLQRQPHACCPCCRAPILAPPQQLHLAAPLHLASCPTSSNCSGYLRYHGQAGGADPPHDIMGLLADMEAALEHLGFRS